MPRDNERILEIWAEVVAQNRKAAIALIEAGAPAGMMHGFFSLAEMAENAAVHLGEGNRDYDERHMAMIEKMVISTVRPYLEEMERMIRKVNNDA